MYYRKGRVFQYILLALFLYEWHVYFNMAECYVRYEYVSTYSITAAVLESNN